MALLEEFEQQGNWLFRHRGIFPIFIFITGLLLFLHDAYTGKPFFLDEAYRGTYEALCLGVSLLGLLIRIYTVGHTPARTSGRNREEQIADELNTNGMYSIVRHPLYLGNFLIWFGSAMLTANFWFLVAFSLYYWIYYERIMFCEEQFLRKKFGKTYTDWAEQVPPFLPDFSKFRKNTVLFSWKKVIINEKNGLASIFFVFLVFDILGNLVQDKTDFDYTLIYLTAGSLLLLLVLKIIKRNTTLFLIEERSA